MTLARQLINHTTLEESGNTAGFSLKTHELFSVHTTLEKAKTQHSPVISNTCLRKNSVRDQWHDVIAF